MNHCNNSLDILVSQLEIEDNKTIIYHRCNGCNDPILITDFLQNGDQCNICKKWYCTKQYIKESEYFNSCSYNRLSGITEVYTNTDEETNHICFNCIHELIYKNDKNLFCNHILNSIENNEGGFSLTIVFENGQYNCKLCDSIKTITIYL
jgi:hypothetical protein